MRFCFLTDFLLPWKASQLHDCLPSLLTILMNYRTMLSYSCCSFYKLCSEHALWISHSYNAIVHPTWEKSQRKDYSLFSWISQPLKTTALLEVPRSKSLYHGLSYQQSNLVVQGLSLLGLRGYTSSHAFRVLHIRKRLIDQWTHFSRFKRLT